MVQITKENGMQSAGVPFAWVEVQYPDKAQWDETGFYDMVEQHVAAGAIPGVRPRGRVRAEPVFPLFPEIQEDVPCHDAVRVRAAQGQGVPALERRDRRAVSGRTGNACTLRHARH